MDDYNCKGTETSWSGNQCYGGLETQIMMYANSLFDNKLSPQNKVCFYNKFIKKYSPKDICTPGYQKKNIDDNNDGFPDNNKLVAISDDIKNIVNSCLNPVNPTNAPDTEKSKTNVIVIIIVVVIFLSIIGFAVFYSMKKNNKRMK